MFGKKLRERVASIERSVERIDSREEEWSLRRRIDRLEKELALLTEALGMVRKEVHHVGYVKRGPDVQCGGGTQP